MVSISKTHFHVIKELSVEYKIDKYLSCSVEGISLIEVGR
jgi:hypothetical protein